MLIKPALLMKLGEMDSPGLLAISLGALGLLANWLLRHQPLTAILATLTLLWLHYGFWSYPLMNHLRPPQQIMQQVSKQLAADDELLLTNFREQFLLFAERPLSHFAYLQSDEPQVADAAVWVQASAHRWVLGPINNLSKCFYCGKRREFRAPPRDDWYLFRADAVLPVCQSAQSSGAPIFHYRQKLIVGE